MTFAGPSHREPPRTSSTTQRPPPQLRHNVARPVLDSTHSLWPPCNMLSRRIVAARPLARAIAPAVARPRPHFTQIRTALTAAERIELADPNLVGYSWVAQPHCAVRDADKCRTAATSTPR